MKYIVIFLTIAILSSCSSSSPTEPTSGIESKPEIAKQAMERLNKYRAEWKNPFVTAGPQLKYNAILEKLAIDQAMNMAKYNYASPFDTEFRTINFIGSGYNLDYDKDKIPFQNGWRYEVYYKSEGDYYGKVSEIKDNETGNDAILSMIQGYYRYKVSDTVSNIYHEHFTGYNSGANFEDVGIGYVRKYDNGKFSEYMCIITASQKK